MATNEWHYTINGQQSAAPVSPAQLKQLAAAGKLQPTDLIWKEGMANWVPASSIKGLFGSSVSVPPLKAPPAPARQAEPEDVVPAEDEDGSGRGGRFKSGGGFATVLTRTFNLNLSAATITPAEQAQLTNQGLAGETAQRYLAWRRSMLFAVGAVTLIAAGLNTIKVTKFFGDEMMVKPNALGKIMEGLYLLSMYALPGGAIAGALLWSKPKLSRLLLLASWGFAFLMPVVVVMTPVGWMVSTPDLPKGLPAEAASEMSKMAAAMAATLLGLEFFLMQLLPAVISVGPGIMRASLRLKSLVPGATLPGWILVIVAPLAVLAMLFPFFPIYIFMAASFLLTLGVALILVAPLVYLVRYKLLTRPLTKYEVPGMNLLQWVSVGVASLGGVFILIFCLTLPGKEDKKGGAPPGGMGRLGGPGKGLGAEKEPPSEKAVITMLVIRLWLDYAGRSLFTGVLAADFLLGGMVLAWRNMQRYGKSQNGPAYEQALTELEPLAAPPSAEKPAKRRKIEPGDYPPEDEE